MKDNIASKLQNLLFSRGELSEAETLYVLAQVRKFSENLSDKDIEKYSVLLFYCDWVLHIKLNHNPVRRILQNLGDSWSSDYESNWKAEFLSFITFRNEFETFLRDFDLPTCIVTNQDYWFEFRKNLIQILIDTPLERTDTRIIKFSLLKKPTIIGFPTDDYMYWYQAIFNNGETEEQNIMFADLGPKRKAEETEKIACFFQRFIDKVEYRRNILNRKKLSYKLQNKN
jgi:hypothetical protein